MNAPAEPMSEQLPLFGKGSIDHLINGDPSRPGENTCPRSKASNYAQYFSIVTHPAFRIGVLDFVSGAPLDHENIRARIVGETPPGALDRLGVHVDRWRDADIENAQIRYEEGRRAAALFGLKFRAWGHPDFPPVAVRNMILKLCGEHQACSA